MGGFSIHMCKECMWKHCFFNTPWPIRCVNLSWGSEWFRMYLDEPHVLDPTQFPASFITLFTDSPLWHGNRALTQTVWEHMSVKYNRGDTVAPAEFVHTVCSLFPCVGTCVTLYVYVSVFLPLTCSRDQCKCTCVCVWVFVPCMCAAMCKAGVFGTQLWKSLFLLSS